MFDRLLLKLPHMRKELAVIVAFAALSGGAIIAQAWCLASALANLWHGADIASQAAFIGGFAASYLARHGVSYARDAHITAFAAQRASELRGALLETVFSEGCAVVSAKGTGALTSMALEGVDDVETYLRLILPKMAAVIVIPLEILIFIFPFDWVSGIIALVMFPFIILYMALIGATAKIEAAKRHREFQTLSNHFVDSLRGIETLAVFGRSEDRGQSLFAASERFREITVKTLRIATLSGSVLDLFATLSLAAVAVMLGFRLVDGSIMLFPAMLTLVLVPDYFKPVRDFAADYHASLDGKNALATIDELLSRPKPQPLASSLGAWDDSSKLEVRSVSFAYDPASPRNVLNDVSITFAGFETVALIGSSGAGKSTLASVLGGFLKPTSGELLVNGERLRHLDTPNWQKNVLYIPQNPYLFHATVRENIAFYRPDASEEVIRAAASRAGLDELIEELPQGMDTIIGEGGRALSGGQAQRIALARAFCDPDRRILIFDEPTAHLDIETEYELKKRMTPLFEGRLVIFATHRLHWLADVDRALVIDRGRVVFDGNASALEGRCAR